MSDTTPLISAVKNRRELVVWSDPLKRICSCFTRSTIKKVPFCELMEKGHKEEDKLMNHILKMWKTLTLSPIDEVELLLILLAMHKTGDVVQIKWHRTEKGQAAKATYKEAKEAFLRNGVIDEA